jgi:LytS/YehU family sensor histidine kinase
MMLQLLAENAVKHGLSELNSGTLLIQIRLYRHYLIYRVVNTHVKPSADVLLNVDHKQADSYAIGINNISQRLAILYPLQHHFRLKLSSHTSALLIFPINISNQYER